MLVEPSKQTCSAGNIISHLNTEVGIMDQDGAWIGDYLGAPGAAGMGLISMLLKVK